MAKIREHTERVLFDMRFNPVTGTIILNKDEFTYTHK